MEARCSNMLVTSQKKFIAGVVGGFAVTLVVVMREYNATPPSAITISFLGGVFFLGFAYIFLAIAFTYFYPDCRENNVLVRAMAAPSIAFLIIASPSIGAGEKFAELSGNIFFGTTVYAKAFKFAGTPCRAGTCDVSASPIEIKKTDLKVGFVDGVNFTAGRYSRAKNYLYVIGGAETLPKANKIAEAMHMALGYKIPRLAGKVRVLHFDNLVVKGTPIKHFPYLVTLGEFSSIRAVTAARTTVRKIMYVQLVAETKEFKKHEKAAKGLIKGDVTSKQELLAGDFNLNMMGQ